VNPWVPRLVRWAAAVALLVIAIRLTMAAFGIPLEAGGLLFTPMLLAAAALCIFAALWTALPWWRRHKPTGLGFWETIAQLLSPF